MISQISILSFVLCIINSSLYSIEIGSQCPKNSNLLQKDEICIRDVDATVDCQNAIDKVIPYEDENGNYSAFTVYWNKGSLELRKKSGDIADLTCDLLIEIETGPKVSFKMQRVAAGGAYVIEGGDRFTLKYKYDLLNFPGKPGFTTKGEVVGPKEGELDTDFIWDFDKNSGKFYPCNKTMATLVLGFTGRIYGDNASNSYVKFSREEVNLDSFEFNNLSKNCN